MDGKYCVNEISDGDVTCYQLKSNKILLIYVLKYFYNA